MKFTCPKCGHTVETFSAAEVRHMTCHVAMVPEDRTAIQREKARLRVQRHRESVTSPKTGPKPRVAQGV